jgi:hypothetical protein
MEGMVKTYIVHTNADCSIKARYFLIHSHRRAMPFPSYCCVHHFTYNQDNLLFHVAWSDPDCTADRLPFYTDDHCREDIELSHIAQIG